MTRNPRTRAGRDLRQISLALTAIHTIDDAIRWRLTSQEWWQTHGHLTNERTLYANGQLGYTHFKLRRAWNVLHRAAETGHVFTAITHKNPRTTSRLEGLNSQIRHLLRHHRGIPTHHRRTAVEWFLLLHEIPLEHAHGHAITPAPATTSGKPDDADSPALYDTALSADEGLWIRTGWAGRG